MPFRTSKKLATRISVSIVCVLAAAVLSSGTALFSAWQVRRAMDGAMQANVPSLRAAEELEISLLEQRGWVASYILEAGDVNWLNELEARKPAFNRWLEEAYTMAHSAEEREILDELSRVYIQYDAKRNEAIQIYNSGSAKRASEMLLSEVGSLFEDVHRLSRKFNAASLGYIEQANSNANRRIRNDTFIVGACVALTLVLGIVLIWQFFQGVVRPVRRMLAEVSDYTQTGSRLPDDEMRAVGAYLRLLMSDVTDARSTLERSREQLIHAEKLASVGKLAASVAHEIRNPLTSIKMWLFWIRSAISAAPDINDAFDVVAGELSRLESVVRNFLDFSRPPELKLQPHDVEELLDKSLELLGHRIIERQVHLSRQPSPGLPLVMADADQIKQVLINLFDNAVESLDRGGEIRISSDRTLDNGTEVVVVRVADSGRGIPPDVTGRIFEPFFTTKEQGTGLGLCIAASIMARHGGRLLLESTSPEGTCFEVYIPVAKVEPHE